MTCQGAPYVGSVLDDPADVGGPVGPGTIPACDDVVVFPPGPQPPTPPAVVTVHRVKGVAPRFAVATPGRDGTLMVAAASPCNTRAAEVVVDCLRARTRRYLTGPSLIAPPSARAGEVIGLAVRVQDPEQRSRPSFGLDALLRPCRSARPVRRCRR